MILPLTALLICTVIGALLGSALYGFLGGLAVLALIAWVNW